MSNETGKYSLFYLNNNDTKSYAKMNNNTDGQFIFSISNSDPLRPFQKVVHGEKIFKQIVDNYSSNSNKTYLTESLRELLQNKTENMPDQNLAAFMNTKNDLLVSGVSRVRGIKIK